ncbi:MAG: hypothetical protein NW223_22765 [Hyphomicrobiaceae bacterium]|nr:hypothetical protein [Hyphomicrobiaceae bacterium]
MFEDPRGAAIIGAIVAAGLLVVWGLVAGADGQVLFSYLFRLAHVLSAMVWVGLIVFINFIQLEATRKADDAGRAVLHATIVPAVAWWVRHASTATIASGAVLLVAAGYALPSLVYGSAVYVPASRALILWLSVLAAFVMWMFVHMYIWPNMQVVIGLRPGDAAARQAARARVVRYSRLNLMLALPVTVVMVAAAHLF